MSELDLFLVMGSESVFSSRGGFGAAGCESGFGVVLRQRVGLRWQVLARLESELFLRQQERLRWWQLTDLGSVSDRLVCSLRRHLRREIWGRQLLVGSSAAPCFRREDQLDDVSFGFVFWWWVQQLRVRRESEMNVMARVGFM